MTAGWIKDRVHLTLDFTSLLLISRKHRIGRFFHEFDLINEQHPALIALHDEYAVSEATLLREIRKQYPDLTIGPAYESEQGDSRIGLVAGIELEPRPGAPTARAMELFHACFDNGLLVRATGDIIALSPPLIVEKEQIDAMFGTIADLIDRID